MDAFDADFEKALVISNDSDLCEPIKLVQLKFGLPVGVLNPHKQPSNALRKVVTFYRPLRSGLLKASQLPSLLTDASGTVTKPAAW